MFFGRIYSRASLQAVVAVLCRLCGDRRDVPAGVEFNVLNVFPGNPIGQLLLIVPAFYFLVAVAFLDE